MLAMYGEAIQELKKREVLTVGIIESLYQAVLNIFIFAWTPILQRSTDHEFNPGMIFINFVFLIILGTKLYEILIIHLKGNLYLAVSLALAIEIFCFGVIYVKDIFEVRFIMCACINGICGFYLPSNSIIKSKILPEKYRSLLMSLFRVPLNIYVIAVLVYIKEMDPFSVSFLKNLLRLDMFIVHGNVVYCFYLLDFSICLSI